MARITDFGTAEAINFGGLMAYGPSVPDLFRRAGEIDAEHKFGWLLHRNVAGLGAAKNLVDVVAVLPGCRSQRALATAFVTPVTGWVR